MSTFSAYAALFFSALIAATFLPMQSEAVMVALMAADYPLVWLLLVATAGNVLGAIVNWGLGLQVHRFQDKKWFPITPDKLDRATVWYHRYGRWSLLLSWAPFIGDPLTMVAGILREPFWTFVAIVTLAKFGRYLILGLLTLGFL